MNRWKAVVFDLDDTLYLERDFVYSGFKAVAGWAELELGISAEQVYDDLNRLFDKGVRGNTFDFWLEACGFEHDDLVSRMVRCYRDHIPLINSYSGVPNLLRRLRGLYRLGIITDGYAEVQRRKLSALDLENYFDVVVFSDEWGKEAWKPSTKPFKIILDKFGILGKEAIYVADNPRKDFFGARRVGMRTIRMRHPEGLYASLEPPFPEYAAHSEIKDLDNLEALIIAEGTAA